MKRDAPARKPARNLGLADAVGPGEDVLGVISGNVGSRWRRVRLCNAIVTARLAFAHR
jgi:hypothetical protein